MTPARIFLAGAAGVVGLPLSTLLVADGHAVVGTTRSASRAERLRALGVTPIVIDVYDRDALREAVVAARPSVVIHQLTDLPDYLDPELMPEGLVKNARIRDIGTRNLIDATLAAGAARMIVQSICFSYSDALGRFEQQVLDAPLDGLVLRYGKFYGPGTGFDQPPADGPLHVDAAADAARRAVTRGSPGIYTVAEDDGTVSIERAVRELGWNPAFRLG